MSTSMKKVKSVVFATKKGGEDGYVEISNVPLNKVAESEKGVDIPVSSGENYADYTLIEWRLRGLTGRILTAVDAAIPQGKQNKATKDIIRAAVMDEFMYFGDQLFDQEELCKQANESFDPDTASPVSFEEILGS